LNWDGEYFFHPDERNIADAVYHLNYKDCFQSFITYSDTKQLSTSECNLNPNFFAYGTLPIYITKFFSNNDFDRTLIVLRVQSAFLSTVNILLVFIITRKLFAKDSNKNKLALITTFLMVFNPGMIQFAHFGTFETYLTFEYLLIALFAIRYIHKLVFRDLVILCIFVGISISTKIISLVMLSIPAICYLYSMLKHNKKLSAIFDHQAITLLLITFIAFFVSSPFILLDLPKFIGSMNYESPVANGTLPVFYTQQFTNTIPIIYQLTKIFPYILGVELTLFSIFGIALLGFSIFKKFLQKKLAKQDIYWLIIISIVITYAGLHFTMYVKWTRYMIPLIPFLILISTYLITKLFSQRPIVVWICCLWIFGVYAFNGLNFSSRYFVEDPRFAARKWIEANIPQDALVLTEPYDLSATAINPVLNGRISDFDMYSLDNESEQFQKRFEQQLASSDYIVILSNRIYSTRFRLPDKFPYTYNFYNKLNSGDLGFRQIVNFSRKHGTSYNNLDLRELSQEPLPDETLDVFDNPILIVYQRNAKT
jgi:hypothetical protein